MGSMPGSLVPASARAEFGMLPGEVATFVVAGLDWSTLVSFPNEPATWALAAPAVTAASNAVISLRHILCVSLYELLHVPETEHGSYRGPKWGPPRIFAPICASLESTGSTATEVLSQNAMNPGERLAKCMPADLSERALYRWLDVKSRAQSVRGVSACFLQCPSRRGETAAAGQRPGAAHRVCEPHERAVATSGFGLLQVLAHNLTLGDSRAVGGILQPGGEVLSETNGDCVAHTPRV